MRNVLIIGAGAIIAYFLLQGRRMATNVKIVLRGFRTGGKLLDPQLILRFGIQNPTDRAATLRSLQGEVIVNDKVVANVSNFSTVKIEANKETPYEVTATPAIAGIFTVIRDLFKTKPRQAIIVRFEGTANVDGINIPLKESLTV